MRATLKYMQLKDDLSKGLNNLINGNYRCFYRCYYSSMLFLIIIINEGLKLMMNCTYLFAH
jgi:hypothetical protein